MNEWLSLILFLRSKQNKPQIQDIHLRELYTMIPSKLFVTCLLIWLLDSHQSPVCLLFDLSKCEPGHTDIDQVWRMLACEYPEVLSRATQLFWSIAGACVWLTSLGGSRELWWYDCLCGDWVPNSKKDVGALNGHCVAYTMGAWVSHVHH